MIVKSMQETLNNLSLFLEEPLNNLMEPLGLMHALKKEFSLTLTLVDFNYYNEALLDNAKSEKCKAVESLNFEWAAKQRELEQECQMYIDLRIKLQMTSSQFAIRKHQLIYFYFGQTDSDTILKQLFEKLV